MQQYHIILTLDHPYGMEVDPVALDQLRGKCVQDIKRTNGTITFKDAVMYQNHMID